MSDREAAGGAAPEWFARGLDATGQSHEVSCEGTRIHCVSWGQPGNPGIVLVHGSNAHLEWWRWVAPFLADQFHVVALDLSGNGDSDWRADYSAAGFTAEIGAVVAAMGMARGWYLVGHSFGGWVALQAAARLDQEMGGVVFMDFTVGSRESYTEWGQRATREGVRPERKLRVYEDLATAVGRFRFIPEQPVPAPAILEHLARASLKAVDGGWTWKFDPTLFDCLEMGADQEDLFLGLRCPAAVVLGEHSDDEGAQDADHMLEVTAGRLPVFHIPGTHHHLMFEEPMAVVAAIKGIVLCWQQARGRVADGAG